MYVFHGILYLPIFAFLFTNPIVTLVSNTLIYLSGPMALNQSTSKAALLKAMKSEMECPICKELFTDPKQLLCGHTFCRECLVRAVSEANNQLIFGNVGLHRSNQFKCPQCRRMHKGKVEDIETNYCIKETAEKMKRTVGEGGDSDGEEEEICSKCARMVGVAELFMCTNCNPPPPPSSPADTVVGGEQLQQQQQSINKLCSLCCVKFHNGHTLRAFKEIIMLKWMDGFKLNISALECAFGENKQRIVNAIEVCVGTLQALHEEISSQTLPLATTIRQRGQQLQLEEKKQLEKMFEKNELKNLRTKRFSRELNNFLRRIAHFDDYVKEFLDVNSAVFDNPEKESYAFDAIRQHESDNEGWGSAEFGEAAVNALQRQLNNYQRQAASLASGNANIYQRNVDDGHPRGGGGRGSVASGSMELEDIIALSDNRILFTHRYSPPLRVPTTPPSNQANEVEALFASDPPRTPPPRNNAPSWATDGFGRAGRSRGNNNSSSHGHSGRGGSSFGGERFSNAGFGTSNSHNAATDFWSNRTTNQRDSGTTFAVPSVGRRQGAVRGGSRSGRGRGWAGSLLQGNTTMGPNGRMPGAGSSAQGTSSAGSTNPGAGRHFFNHDPRSDPRLRRRPANQELDHRPSDLESLSSFSSMNSE